LSYKVLRSIDLRNLLRDFSKYLEPNNEKQHICKINGREVIKNGWANLVNFVDFSAEDKNKLLVESVTHGWDPWGVEVLVTELKANPNTLAEYHDIDMSVATLAARNGNHEILKSLIEVKARVWEDDDILGSAALRSKEECVRLLLDAGCYVSPDLINVCEFMFDGNPLFERVLNLLKGQNVPPLRPKISDTITTEIEDILTAAMEGTFTDYLDIHM